MQETKDDSALRLCNCCKSRLPLVSFHKDRRLRLGRRYTCKTCAKTRSRLSLERNLRATSGLCQVFQSIKKRCYDRKHKSFYAYGAKGILVCEEWLVDPCAFYEWALRNGYRRGMQIDRIDSNGGYYPNNCRCVNARENVRNRDATKLTVEKVAEIKRLIETGVRQKDIAETFGVHQSTISNIKTGKVWGDVRC
jgi:hypothetical protein